MDKMNFVRDGGSKLPPGFRFEPTDEEIVFMYLARKIFSYPLPARIIPEISNIFSFDPWELPGDSDQERYFFSNKETNHRAAGRATCSGYWKPTASSKRIICSKMKPMIGIRKSLVFYKWKNGRALRTNWIMHEYYIALSENESKNNQQMKSTSEGSNLVRVGDWTLCRVFMKNNNGVAQVDDSENINGRNCADDYMSDADSSCASSTSPHFDSNSGSLNDEVSSGFDDVQ